MCEAEPWDARAGQRAMAVGTAVTRPIEGPEPATGLPADAGPGPPARWVVAPRLVRTRLRLTAGREVGVAVAGRGMPLVVVHGFAGEGVLYAQTLSRLVGMGFLVVAIDSPGHGATDGLSPLAPIGASVGLIRDAVAALGIRRAVLAGHSMGGRLVAELAAGPPGTTGDGLAVAVVLVDAIVGDVWDRMNRAFRFMPAAYGVLGAALLADTISTFPVWSDPTQAVKLTRLVFPTGANHVRRPWRLLGPLAAIVRAPASGSVLDHLRARSVPVVVIHGEHDLPVPVPTARAAAARAGADLVIVRGARHSWLLRDPSTFPAILAELLDGRVGRALRNARAQAGLGPDATLDEVQAAFCEPGALVADLAPGPGSPPRRIRSRPPRFRWTTTPAVA
jgi:pimeloyl-ACP methyl ester carboxylesterase